MPDLMLILSIWAVTGMAATWIDVEIPKGDQQLVKLPFWGNCLIGFLTPVALVCLPVIIPVGFVIAFFVSIYNSIFGKKDDHAD